MANSVGIEKKNIPGPEAQPIEVSDSSSREISSDLQNRIEAAAKNGEIAQQQTNEAIEDIRAGLDRAEIAAAGPAVMQNSPYAKLFPGIVNPSAESPLTLVNTMLAKHKFDAKNDASATIGMLGDLAHGEAQANKAHNN